jgi:hypothetical protein
VKTLAVSISPAKLGKFLARFFKGKGLSWLIKQIDAGACDGGCLLVANALVKMLPGSSIVTMRRGTFPGITEHYGILWQGWYFDGMGGFPNSEEWCVAFEERFCQQVYVVDEFVEEDSIQGHEWFVDDLIKLMEPTIR